MFSYDVVHRCQFYFFVDAHFATVILWRRCIGNLQITTMTSRFSLYIVGHYYEVCDQDRGARCVQCDSKSYQPDNNGPLDKCKTRQVCTDCNAVATLFVFVQCIYVINIKNAYYCNQLIIIVLKGFKKKISLSFSGHNVIGATCSMLTWAVRYETPAAGVTQDSTSGRGTTLSVCPTECAPWGTVRRTMVSNYGILNSREC